MDELKTKLNHLRQEIDTIDDTIIELLIKRMGIVRHVGHLKTEHSDGLSFIRAGREATMLRDISKKLEGYYPAQAVASIWRMIISSSLHKEQMMNVGCYDSSSNHLCYWQAREYYGAFTHIERTTDADTLINKVEQGELAVGILPLFDQAQAPWWNRPENESNDIYIFARIPFVEQKDSPIEPVLAIANVKPEPTENDVTLVVVHTNCEEEELIVALADNGIKIQVLATTDHAYLIEIHGFVTSEDTALHQAVTRISADTHARVLGSYASPTQEL